MGRRATPPHNRYAAGRAHRDARRRSFGIRSSSRMAMGPDRGDAEPRVRRGLLG